MDSHAIKYLNLLRASKYACLLFKLEDKRAEMEKRLISMKIQHQSLQKQHGFSKQQLHRMKVC